MHPTENQAVSGENFLLFFVRSSDDNGVIGIRNTDFARTTWRSQFDKELGVDLGIIFPLSRDIILIIDRLDWTDGFAGTAIHALIGLYVEHASALIDAIHRALFDARLVFHIDTRLRNYVSQGKPPCGQCRHSNPHGS